MTQGPDDLHLGMFVSEPELFLFRHTAISTIWHPSWWLLWLRRTTSIHQTAMALLKGKQEQHALVVDYIKRSGNVYYSSFLEKKKETIYINS